MKDLEYETDFSDERTVRSKLNRPRFYWATAALALGMLSVGLACSVAFCIGSVRAAENDEVLRFEKEANKIAQAVVTAWAEYETIGLWIHQSMRLKTNFSTFAEDREAFKILCRYIKATGVHPTAMGYVTKLPHSTRDALEAESRAYYQKEYPEYDYKGYSAMYFNRSSPMGYELGREEEHEFYFPMLLLQPFRGNEYYIDLDLYTSPTSKLMLEASEKEQVLASTPYPSFNTTKGKHMMMLHPGTSEDRQPDFDHLPRNHGLASVLMSFGPFMERVARKQEASVSVYIYVRSDTRAEYVAFGGSSWTVNSQGTITSTVMADTPTFEELLTNTPSSKLLRQYDLEVTQKPMKVVVVDDDDLYHTSLWSACWGGILMFVATLMLVVWLTTHVARGRRLAWIRQQAEAEKAALICHNAHAMVHAERRRNEYLAHEVRNPLASAMAACSFLETSHQKHTSNLEGACDTDREVTEDIRIISSSLSFINDLLRSMLDTSKIASQSLVLQSSPTDLFEDVLQPVRTMIDLKDNAFAVRVECDDELMVLVDRMRLKQVILNLAGNARKFVQRGYIRLTARVIQPSGIVRLAVEDSGPGIPAHKKCQVFQRFQESLDQLNQGTGMGLSLCHGLVDLMGGELYLDESYHSGIPDSPGARFVVDLPAHLITTAHTSTISSSSHRDESEEVDLEDPDPEACPERVSTKKTPSSLPLNLRVLITDDDAILRKMLSRSIKRLAPTWSIREAANGETALSIIDGIEDDDGEAFDLIFMDHYMASVEKQLLGTETVQKLRARGVTSRICGLSANDMKTSFLDAGANAFLFKPFKTNSELLRMDLLQVLGLIED